MTTRSVPLPRLPRASRRGIRGHSPPQAARPDGKRNRVPIRTPHPVRSLILLVVLLLGSGLAHGRDWEPGFRDLAGWGRDMHLRPIVVGQDLLLTNRWTRMRFRKDSDRMTFNEVEFRLSDRIPVEVGRFRVSQRDIDSLMAPLLAPPKRSARPIRRIAINAGHGGRDPGNMEGKRMEKTYTLDLATDLARHLKAAGFQVVFIRSSDRFIELPERAAIANRADADLYVSLHFNGFDGPGSDSVQGLETYCLTPAGAPSSNDSQRRGRMAGFEANRFDRENLTLAHQVHRAILDQTPLADRGVRRARFKELTLLRMPGLLVEGGYMTHPQDAASIYSPSGRAALARAIADGVLAYKRLVERTP